MPAEIRGQFKTIATRVPGLRFSEHVPHLAGVADRFTLVRSLTHKDIGHPSAAYEMTTGHPYPRAMNLADNSTRDDHPHIGATVAAVAGGSAPVPFALVPDYLVVNGQFRSGQNAGFLGKRFDPLVPGGDPSRDDFHPPEMGLGEVVERSRLDGRRALLARFNAMRVREASGGAMGQMDSYREKAFSLLEAGTARQAFDLDRESPATCASATAATFSASPCCWPGGWSRGACGWCTSIACRRSTAATRIGTRTRTTSSC